MAVKGLMSRYRRARVIVTKYEESVTVRAELCFTVDWLILVIDPNPEVAMILIRLYNSSN